jgi:stalled ribosome rescue protein Dom34
MEECCRVLGETPEKAFYGMRHVWLAAGKGAVEVLMISDALFR